jgi:hypothetical protein
MDVSAHLSRYARARPDSARGPDEWCWQLHTNQWTLVML